MTCTKHNISWCACRGPECPRCKLERIEEEKKKTLNQNNNNNVPNQPNVNR